MTRFFAQPLAKLTLAALLASSPAIAQGLPPDHVSPAIAGYEAGIICAVAPDRIDAAPDTVSGTKHVVEERPPFVSTSRRVPAVTGVGFGVSAEAVAANGLSGVTMVVTHPPMAPNGTTQQSFVTRIPGGEPGITFYQFDYDYELLLGRWTLTVVDADGSILFSVPFEVVPPQSVPALAEACNYAELLS